MKAPSSQRSECTRKLLNPPLRILLVGARSMIRARLRLLIESHPDLKLTGEAASHSRAVAMAYRDKPDLILVDGHTSTSKLIAAIRELSAAAGSRVLVFDGEYRIDVHREAVRNGAEDMVILERLPETLTTTLYPEAVRIASLTELERAVIASVVLGLTDNKIAARLRLSVATVRGHLKSIFTKLGVTDRLELVVYSFLHGLARDKQLAQRRPVSPRPMTLSKGPRMKNSRRSAASR